MSSDTLRLEVRLPLELALRLDVFARACLRAIDAAPVDYSLGAEEVLSTTERRETAVAELLRAHLVDALLDVQPCTDVSLGEEWCGPLRAFVEQLEPLQAFRGTREAGAGELLEARVATGSTPPRRRLVVCPSPTDRACMELHGYVEWAQHRERCGTCSQPARDFCRDGERLWRSHHEEVDACRRTGGVHVRAGEGVCE
jgi:hypothetical protein